MADGGGSGLLGRLFSTVLILGLLGVVGWLLSERNAHHYFLHTDGRMVLIERGFMLPYGHGPYRPRDPALDKAYAPVRLPDGMAAPADEELEERGDLDRRLGEILLEAAKTRLSQTDAARLTDGIAYLDRAMLLQQLGFDQRRELQSQRAEVAYFEAADRISRALAALQDAQGLLRLATTGSQAHAKEAADLLDRLGPALDGLLRATRASSILPADDADLPATPVAAAAAKAVEAPAAAPPATPRPARAADGG
ncbi:MAG TPA: hypothetical protein VMB50_13520 [Myxococcales bacterium]|nr:hypothetical protein [Myxococcales bacterium]